MYKQQNDKKLHFDQTMRFAPGAIRPNRTLQSEIGKLYDKSKNSYSKKFQMKMQFLSDPYKSVNNRSFDNTMHISKRLELEEARDKHR